MLAFSPQSEMACRRASSDCVLSTFVSSFMSAVCRITAAASVRFLHAPPPFSSHSTALDAALDFQQQFVVPSTWKTEVKEESSSSENDDEEEDEEQEEDASGEEEEVEASLTQPPSSGNVCKRSLLCLQEEVEPFPEERENFLQQLYKFMEDRGEPSQGFYMQV